MSTPRIAIVVAMCGAFVLLSAPVNAQTDSLPDFKNIRTPASPAFVILGKESSLDHSDDPAAIASSLKQLATNLNNLPSNFALEVSPYWLFKHQDLTWRSDVNRSLGEAFARTFTLSIASGVSDDTIQPIHELAGGFRFSLICGSTSDSSQKLLMADENFAKHMSDTIQVYVSKSLRAMNIQNTDPRRNIIIDSLLRELQSQWKDSVTSPFRVATYTLDRQGPFLDVAGAFAYAAPQGIWDSLRYSRMALWLTTGYEMATWSALLTAKYSAFDDSAKTRWLDFGVKAQIPIDRYAFEGELLGRAFLNQTGAALQTRYDLTFSYDLGKQNWLSFKVGKDFDSSKPNSVIVVAGINLNLSDLRYLPIGQ